MTRRCEASGAGMAASHPLPQSAGFAITSDLSSVVGSPSRMASSSTSNVSRDVATGGLDPGTFEMILADSGIDLNGPLDLSCSIFEHTDG